MKKKKIGYVDMDGVMCIFFEKQQKALKLNPKQKFPQAQWGFFLDLEPMEGAIESFHMLSDILDLYILTKPSYININCYSEKAYWVQKHLGTAALKKTIFSCNKSLLKGDYLIDDQENANQLKFEGELIKFGTKKFPDWKNVMNYIVKKEVKI